MFSGVSGMRTHQTKMDVIGNNIANVNTFGFKASRATFSEVYFQTLNTASAATPDQGGRNATQIGFGVGLAAVDVQHTRAGFQMTDNGMDLAIAGDGFFQVQDRDGNLFFSRVGMLRIDAVGNLVDQNGNFVLGVAGDPSGRAPSNERIQFNVPSLVPNNASATEFMGNRGFTITASQPTQAGNVNMSFTSRSDLPIGQRALANMTSNGIHIVFNANEVFTNLSDINDAINTAIQEANGGIAHPAGNFNIELATGQAIQWPLQGMDIVSSHFVTTPGNVSIHQDMQNLGFSLQGVSSQFAGSGNVAMNVVHQSAPEGFLVSLDINGVQFTRLVPSTALQQGTIKLGEADNYVVLNHPGYVSLLAQHQQRGLEANEAFFASDLTIENGATPSSPSKSLGFGSRGFSLRGGQVEAEQSVSNLLNIGIGADGVITGVHAQQGFIALGRIDLATFANPQGLLQVGNSYFALSSNSGAANLNQAGLGGSGSIQAGALELSNVDLSREFAEMITTQRGFQASARLITVSDEILNELVNLKR